MRSSQIAIISFFAAVIYVLSFSSKYLSYPILPYLKFDPAEIIVVLSLFLFGPATAIFLSFLHFILLHFPYAEYPIIGPGMKLLAELSTVLAAYFAFSLPKNKEVRIRLLYSLGLAFIFRNFVMTIANYLVLVTLFSGAIDFIFEGISRVTGIHATTIGEKLLLILIFTGLYNTIHILISILPAFMIALLPSMPQLIAPISKHWLYTMMNKDGK